MMMMVMMTRMTIHWYVPIVVRLVEVYVLLLVVVRVVVVVWSEDERSALFENFVSPTDVVWYS